jgi:hypothetical protein
MNDLSKPFVYLPAQEAPQLPLRTKYPFTQMGIGDVLLFNDSKKAESARVAAYLFSKRHRTSKPRFSLRKAAEGWCLTRVK